MARWSRRQVLSALAAAGAAPAWSSLIGACGAGATGGSRVTSAAAARSGGDLREQLRQAVAELETRFAAARARGEIARETRAVMDASGGGIEQGQGDGVVVGGFDGTGWIEQATRDVSVDGVKAAVELLMDRGKAGTGKRGAGTGKWGFEQATGDRRQATGDRRWEGKIDPRGVGAERWMEEARGLHERVRAMGGSRMVYRAVAIEVDDRESVVVDGEVDVVERVVRTRGRVLFLAWTGDELWAEEVAHGRRGGLEVAAIPERDLDRAVEGALAHVADAPPEPGERALLLDPSVTAAFLRHGVARGFEGDAWVGGARAATFAGKTVAVESVTVRDDATAAGAYGGYGRDDEGWTAAPIALIEAGVVRGPMTDAATAAALGIARTGHGRRAGVLSPARPRASHLALAVGGDELDAQISRVADGFLIEGALGGVGDPRSWHVALRARRAKEIAGGRLTGRSYGPVTIAGDVATMLGAMMAPGATARELTWRTREDGGALASSASAPHIVTRAWMGGAWR